MKPRVDQVFKNWAFNKMSARRPQRGATHVAENRDWQDSSLAAIWGIVPVYTGKVIRRSKKEVM